MAVGPTQLDEDRVAHRLGVGLFRRMGFVEFVAGFASAPVFCAREPQDAVAGAVGEEFAFHLVAAVFDQIPAGDRGDFPVLGFNLFDRGIQKHGEILLTLGEPVHDVVPDSELHGRVEIVVVELELFQQAGFLAVVAVRAADPHADFARSVAAEHRPVLQNHRLRPVPRRSNRRAESRHAAADHDEVGRKFASGNRHLAPFPKGLSIRANCKTILSAFVPSRRFCCLEALLSVALLRRKRFKTTKSLRPSTKS